MSTELYGRLHFRNGPANAFRHAYWNYAIAEKCLSVRRNENKVLTWTKKVTDWHENAFPNRELDKLMDLHNNKVGRHIFMKTIQQPKTNVLEIFKEMTTQSQKITAPEDITKLENRLVHIIDE
ncbi:hypothetical protein PP183_09845 [Muricauda sp. AC10]|nr:MULTISPECIES: hypothetical protein [Allomuricauda]MDC6366370.1 hypothetical protein [Muricauda sp. AC10]